MSVVGIKTHKQTNMKPDFSLNLPLKPDIDDWLPISHHYKLYSLVKVSVFQVFASVNYQLFHQ